MTNGSGSGLQSPPYDDDSFDATLPTNELKSALFGPASSIRQNAQTTDRGTGTPHVTVGSPQAVAPVAASGQLQQQVLQQLQSSHYQAGPNSDINVRSGSAAMLPAHNQQAFKSFTGFAKQQQDVPHNARLWSIPVASPKLVTEFSLMYSNPLAEHAGQGQLAGQLPLGAAQDASQEQLDGADQCSEHVLSLMDLASMDPSSL